MKKSLAFAIIALLLLSVVIFSSCGQGEKPSGLADGDAAAPVIVQQPNEIIVRNGEGTQALSIEAYLNDGGSISYQWYSNSTDSVESGVKIDGATKKIYMPNVSVNGVTYYYCVVTNTNNALSGEKVATTVSKPVMVKVYSSVEPPIILSSPRDFDYVVDSLEKSLPMMVEATVAKGTLSYQWYVTVDGNYDNASAIENATLPEYNPPISTVGEVYYFCEITNTDDTASEGNVNVVRTKPAKVSVDYELENFVFEAISGSTCKLVEYLGTSLRPYIPETDSEGRAVTEIGIGVFANTSITAITIPKTVKTLGAANVTDPDGVFNHCASLKEIKFEGQFKFIGDFCFSGCISLETNLWSMCEEIETIGRGAFNSVNGLPENLVFPATIKGTIGEWCFEKVNNVKTITFAGNGITAIKGAAFATIPTLESFVFPASVTSVSDALKGCSALKSVTFERSVLVNGSITSGVPFIGTEYPELQIFVPGDSYDNYCSSLANYKQLIKDESSVPHTATIVGATINGQSSFSLLAGSGLDASANVVYTQDNNLGWVYGGVWYETYAELAADFFMTSKDCVVQAVYAEDFTTLFVPSCYTEKKEGGSVMPTSAHVTDGEGNIIATRFSATAGDNVTYYKITNVASKESHHQSFYNLASISEKNCLLLTFTNNSDKEVTLTYEVEAWGVQSSVTVTLAGGETKTVFAVVDSTGSHATDQPIHQMKVENAADGYDVTIYGYRVI